MIIDVPYVRTHSDRFSLLFVFFSFRFLLLKQLSSTRDHSSLENPKRVALGIGTTLLQLVPDGVVKGEGSRQSG